MTSSAFTNFLSSLKLPGSSARPSLLGGEVNAKLVGVPSNVANEILQSRKSVTLQGEVVSSKDDGTIKVRTDRGDVVFKAAPGERIPAEGQQVEIEIPPNVNAKKEPDVAAYRRLPQQTQQPTTEQTPSRSSGTPVDVDVQPDRAPRVSAQSFQTLATSSQPAPALPPEDTPVRLDAFPPKTQEVLPPYEPLEQLAARVINVDEVLLSIISANAQSDLARTLSEAISKISLENPLQTPVQKTSALATPLIITDTLAPALTSPGAPQPNVLQTLALAQNIQISPQPTQSPFITAPAGGEILQTPLKFFAPGQSVSQVALVRASPSVLNLQPALQTPAIIGDVLPKGVSPKLQNFIATIQGQPGPAIDLTAISKPGEPQKPQLLQALTKPEALIAQNQKPEQIVGVVTNITQNKLPVVSVFFPQAGTEQNFALQFPTEKLAVGTQLLITPQTAAQNALPAAQILPELLPLPIQLAPQYQWPVFDEITQSLTQAAPHAAQAFINGVPSPANPAQLPPALLFFMAAVRGGDLTQWLSEKTIETLKSTGKSSLLSRLTQEGSSLSRISSEALPQDWRAMNIPLTWQNEMHKIALFYRHEHEGGDEGGGKHLKSTRFVFDLKLDAMGKVQLDGLFRPVSEAGKRLDLVVRTEQFFSQATQGEMRRVYARALRDTGVTGELSFQNRPETWVTVKSDGNTLMMSS